MRGRFGSDAFSLAEASSEIETIQRRFNRERLESIQERKPGLNVLHRDGAQRSVFRQAAGPMHGAYIERSGERGAQLLETLRKAVKDCEATKR